LHPAETSNATFFLMADHSLDRTWPVTAAAVAFAGETSSSSSEPEVRAVYAPPPRGKRPPRRR
jgi:hypothetical protein